MMKNKLDVDRHVEQIYKKITGEAERNLKSLSIAKLYFSVGEFDQARKFVTKYINSREDSTVAWKLLAQITEASKEPLDQILDAYITCYQLDSVVQKEVILKICELLCLAQNNDSSDSTQVDLERKKYWLNIAERVYPSHRAVQRLKANISGEKVPLSDHSSFHLNNNESQVNGMSFGSPSLSSFRNQLISNSSPAPNTPSKMVLGGQKNNSSFSGTPNVANRNSSSVKVSSEGGGIVNNESLMNNSASCYSTPPPTSQTPNSVSSQLCKPSPERLHAQLEAINRSATAKLSSSMRDANELVVSELRGMRRDFKDISASDRQSIVDEMQSQRQAIVDLKIVVKEGLYDLRLELTKVCHVIKDELMPILSTKLTQVVDNSNDMVSQVHKLNNKTMEKPSLDDSSSSSLSKMLSERNAQLISAIKEISQNSKNEMTPFGQFGPQEQMQLQMFHQNQQVAAISSALLSAQASSNHTLPQYPLPKGMLMSGGGGTNGMFQSPTTPSSAAMMHHQPKAAVTSSLPNMGLDTFSANKNVAASNNFPTAVTPSVPDQVTPIPSNGGPFESIVPSPAKPSTALKTSATELPTKVDSGVRTSSSLFPPPTTTSSVSQNFPNFSSLTAFGNKPSDSLTNFSFLSNIGENKSSSSAAPSIFNNQGVGTSGLSQSTKSEIEKVVNEVNEKEGEEEEEEEYDPCPEFKAIVPLPDKIDVVTGEENEIVLFQQRAKLYRFVDKEWKERGLGEIKILKKEGDGGGCKIRILMRREQTFKICCNHYISKDMSIDYLKAGKGGRNALTWITPSDLYEGVAETQKFCLKLKTEDQATEFLNHFKDSVDFLANNNTSSVEKSIAAAAAKSATTSSQKDKDKETTTIKTNLMDKFKPKVGSWECSGCLMRNGPEIIKCPACDSIQPGKQPPPPPIESENKLPKPKFNFGFVANKTHTIENDQHVELRRYEKDSKYHLSFDGRSLKLDCEDDAKKSVCKDISNHGDGELECLTLSGNTFGIGAAKAIGEALESRSELRYAMWRDMFTGRMKTEIPPALSHLGGGLMKADCRLLELDLSDNAFGPIGMEGLKDLLLSPVCSSLKVLRLNNTGCGVTGGRCLASLLSDAHKTQGMRLEIFVLGRSRQENEGAIALANVFKAMKSLKEVVMPQNGIYSEGIEALSEAFAENKELEMLNLNDNTFTERGGKLFADIALHKLKNLKYLNLGDCLLGDNGALTIVKALEKHCSKLETLMLDSNELHIESGMEIGRYASLNGGGGKNLKSLCLDCNCFGGEIGIKKIMKVIGNKERTDQLFSSSEGTILNDEDDQEGEDEDNETSREVIEEPSKPSITTNNIFGNVSTSLGGSTSIFGGSSNSGKSIFGGGTPELSTGATSIFSSNNTSNKGPFSSSSSTVFGGIGESSVKNSIFSLSSTKENVAPSAIFGTSSSFNKSIGLGEMTGTASKVDDSSTKKDSTAPSSIFSFGGGGNSSLSFASLSNKSLNGSENKTTADDSTSTSSNGVEMLFGKPIDPNSSQTFSFSGAGSAVFGKGTTSKNNTQDNVDGGEDGGDDDESHDPHFEPIVPLPSLVEVTTGEESEDVIFQSRAKCYRYVNGEWKERGVGEMKVLKSKSNQFRVLLRRDQVHKVALNHLITPDIDIQPHLNSETAVTYSANDFSDNEHQFINVAIKFKLAETCKKFSDVFKQSQKKSVTEPTKCSSGLPVKSLTVAGDINKYVTPEYSEEEEEEEYDSDEESVEEELKIVCDCELSVVQNDDQDQNKTQQQAPKSFGAVKLSIYLEFEGGEDSGSVGGYTGAHIRASKSSQSNRSDEDRYLCNHMIDQYTDAQFNPSQLSIKWSALDFADDVTSAPKPLYKHFLAKFSNQDEFNEFKDTYYEVHEMICSLHAQE